VDTITPLATNASIVALISKENKTSNPRRHAVSASLRRYAPLPLYNTEKPENNGVLQSEHNFKEANMKIRKSVFIAIGLFLSGCAANPSINTLTGEQRARLNTVQVSAVGTDKPYKVIGKAEGLSCHRNAYAPRSTTETEAMEGVKINAVLMNADAVINVACQNNGVDWGNNCWASIVCIGDAITFNK
jgi:hypothetical protein